MFDSSKLYKMLKPDSNPDLITSLPVFIAGTTAVPDLINGAIIVHLINNKPITSQYKNMQDINLDKEKGSSKIQSTQYYEMKSIKVMHYFKKLIRLIS